MKRCQKVIVIIALISLRKMIGLTIKVVIGMPSRMDQLVRRSTFQARNYGGGPPGGPDPCPSAQKSEGALFQGNAMLPFGNK